MHHEYMNYMGHHWILVEDNTVTIGINEDALNEIDKISDIALPSEGEEVEQDAVCGEIETSDGTYKMYAPVSGIISEINPDVVDEPSLVFEDPYESWLYKIEASDEAELNALFNDSSLSAAVAGDDVDEDEDDEEDEDEDDDLVIDGDDEDSRH